MRLSKISYLIKLCDSHNPHILDSMPYMFENIDNHNQSAHSHHDHNHDHDQVCGQCGKLHSKYFIENHYCICQTLFNIPSKDFEEYIVSNFLTRAPPTSNFI